MAGRTTIGRAGVRRTSARWPLHGFVDGDKSVAHLSVKFRGALHAVAAVRRTNAKKPTFCLLWLGHLRGVLDTVTSPQPTIVVDFARARWQEYMEQQYEEALKYSDMTAAVSS